MEKTVLFSSHIMQEVQALCDRVIIINKGKIVANDSIDMLTQYEKQEKLLIVEFSIPIEENKLLKIPGIKSVKSRNKNKFHLLCDQEVEVREAVFHLAVEEKASLLEMRLEDFTMEDVFTKLTAN